MDVTFTTKFDEKRYARAIRRVLSFSFRSITVYFWCMGAAWLVFMFAWWLKGWPEGDRSFALSIPVFCACCHYYFRIAVRVYVRQMRQMLGDMPATCRITDKGYETVCGDLVQKMPWQKVMKSAKPKKIKVL